MEAKALAEEQKRLNPDCWKRKRTNSVRATANDRRSPIVLLNNFHTVHQQCITPACPAFFPQGSQQT